MKRRGIILAGGYGKRLFPITKVISKHLLPIYDKPMIYYPLSTLMMAGIREIFIITKLKDLSLYKDLLGDGKSLGIEISYGVQNQPNGIAACFQIAESFIKGHKICLILGDNIFYGNSLQEKLKKAQMQNNGATIFSYRLKNSSRYGVLEIDKAGIPLRIIEKPKDSNSNLVITGLYFYDEDVIQYAKSIKPSSRGELEITDINMIYLKKKKLHVEEFRRGFTWLDAGTCESLIKANQFVETIETRQGLKICCPEEIAFKKNWIDAENLRNSAQAIGNSYGDYLISLI